MAGYGYVGQVTDPNAKKALQVAMDLIIALRSELDTLKVSALTNAATVDAGGQRITAVASPQANEDAANAAYVKAYVAAQLEAFKGLTGVSGTIDTTAAQIVTVENGIITEIV